MLSLFPEVLFLAPAAITLIRVTIAIAYLLMAYRIFARAERFTGTHFPIVGYPPAWLLYTAVAVCGIVGAFLFVGAYTQAFAIIAALGALKQVIGRQFWGDIFPFSTAANVFLLIMSISLIFSGAGAFAFDWPL